MSEKEGETKQETTKKFIKNSIEENKDQSVADLQKQINAFNKTMVNLTEILPKLERIAGLEAQLTQVAKIVKDFNAVGRMGKYIFRGLAWLAGIIGFWNIITSEFIKSKFK